MKTLVIIPTYNERETLRGQVAGVRKYAPEVDILIADDNSPDGTGAIADELAANDPQIQVMHRPGKQGLGDAYVAGFKWGLERGYELLCEMDADGSHRAVDFPRLLRRAGRPDQPGLVIGSRWVSGGSVVNWPLHRKILSRGGNDYVALMLGIKVKDATAGFRVYRAETLEAIHLDEVESHGYCFQVDMTWRTLQAGCSVVEVPIQFVERAAGNSKMSQKIVNEALFKTTTWGIERRLRRLGEILRSVK